MHGQDHHAWQRGNAAHELAELVIELTGSRSEIVFKNLPQDDPTQRRPDITLAGTALGWEPKVMLNEGLKRTIEYFETVLTEAVTE